MYSAEDLAHLGANPDEFRKILDFYERTEEKFLPIELVKLIEKFYPNAETSFFSNGKHKKKVLF